MIKKALIFGVTCQYGSYLTTFLLKKYAVHGVIRRSSSINTKELTTFSTSFSKK